MSTESLNSRFFYEHINHNFRLANGYDMPKILSDHYYQYTLTKLTDSGLRFFRIFLEPYAPGYNGIRANPGWGFLPNPSLNELIDIANSEKRLASLALHRKRWFQTLSKSRKRNR